MISDSESDAGSDTSSDEITAEPLNFHKHLLNMISSDPDLLRSVLWFVGARYPSTLPLALKLHHSISELFSNIHAIPSSYEIAVQNRTMVIIVERFVESDKAEKMLRGLVEQMMNVEPVVLRTSMLSVSFMGEN